ncbi:uncharacterized protein Z518_00667 [Rhinocladiella mackenziei CBS 650.93]|uniref:Dipeptidase n=1 Tax=Rhinocladiella mackenziei CBS 650.93 TaxID=1442369 RepID=A0A0D2G4H5_9EURO|nr:uncharacterized protein Z518_00667 [Rhinocladiella mackenziei CBS 650.93]KIX09587.1 hypothetical protein Z518_00667 [Rhinocladiella mackenziei CBS 650.93]
MQQIDLVYRLIDEYPDHLAYAESSRDVLDIFGSGNHRIASLLGIEGLHQIGGSASVLRLYHRLGVKYATLTHTCHNEFADSEEPTVPLHGGLSEAGVALIKEMNRIGMMVDLSHTSWQTQRDAFRVTKAPVVYSHSNAFALCAHTRNVPDDLLQTLKANGGVIMATFYPAFVDANASKITLDKVADHIEYLGNTIGYDHVGIGSDFDGMMAGPKGLEDVSKYPDLVEELLNRGFSEENVSLVMGKNVLRVMDEVKRVAKTLGDQKPLEDDVKKFFEELDFGSQRQSARRLRIQYEA